MNVDADLSISVLIPTKNRPLDLQRTVETVLCQSAIPRELIIVDQSPEDESQIRVQELFSTVPKAGLSEFKLSYIRDSSISGLATARNRAITIAQGDIWLFLDDDVCLERDFLKQLLLVYQHYPQAVGVSGIITNYTRPAWDFRCWNWIFVRGAPRDDRQLIYWRAEELRNSDPIRVRQFTGALMSFRASVIENLRFDSNLTGASLAEDIDFCARLPRGSLLLVAPKARLTHKRSPDARETAHWISLHAQANNYMRERHWRTGLLNNICFAWLNLGYLVACSFASFRCLSLDPWRSWRHGVRKGIDTATKIHQDSSPYRRHPLNI